jgi:WD40 repeat protein
MSLATGARLGPYEVTAQIGAGGMGEVYSATDTNLKRNVALKVLPAAVATDTGRLSRLQREAEVLASLNHPNIAAIYGLERSGDTMALVMELVEGPTLAERIGQGAIPLDESLAIAEQIAAALEAAHEQGIVHRDLKPANVKVRADGTVKVLDFGLAKAMEPAFALRASAGQADAAAAISASQMPTLTSPAMTQMGIILGTAAYMAPEQASGRPVDKRADIWAFGVVLWEMLAGRQMFEGETVSHVLAAVLTKEPDLSAVPARVRPLLARCLEKDPRRRLRDIGDAMSLVRADDKVTSAPVTVVASAAASSRRLLAAGGWTTAAVLAGALVWLAWLRPPATVESERVSPLVRFQIARTPDVYNRTATAFAVSPDGLRLAYYGDEGTALLVRVLGTGEVRAIPNSASAAPQRDSLFWLPDNRHLVLGAGSGTQVFDVMAGSVRPLCDCRWVGGSANRDGTILLGGFGTGVGVSRLKTGERNPVTVTQADASRGEQDAWPVFLPDGRRFLFTRRTASGDVTYYASLDGGEPARIADGSVRAFVDAEGERGPYLLGIDASGLVAQPFDPDALTVTGAATTVVPGAVALSVSANGVLATSRAGSRPRTIPTWFDRSGKSLGQVGDAGFFEALALSADGRKLVIAENSPSSAQGTAIWLRDLENGVRTRLTIERGSAPVWSPDGSRIAFSALRDGFSRLYQRAIDGTGGETALFTHEGQAYVNDWSADGSMVIYSTNRPDRTAGNDLFFMPMIDRPDRKPVPYVVSPVLEQQAQFSPDGRFVAYGSDQSGTFEVYVQTFPDPSAGKWMVSNGGGVEPRWNRDGKELFYFSGPKLMAVPVTLRPTFSAGMPVALFEAPIQTGYTADSHRWQLAPDGKRFLLLANVGKDQAQPLDVAVNWLALLKNSAGDTTRAGSRR